jgi:hypothetical protein
LIFKQVTFFQQTLLKDEIFVGQHPLIEEDKINSPLFPQLDFLVEEIFS